ncbi:MAG: carbohydrate binding domain-containing protein, partial [Ruminococcus sp.]
MKEKLISLIIAFLTAISVIPSYSEEIYAETDNQKIILSNDFENNNMGSWFPFGEGTLSIADNTSHSGESCLKVTDRENTYNGPY